MIVIVFGLPGAGKSFFSQKLSDELKIPRLNTDEIREKAGKKGQYDDQSVLHVYQQMNDEMKTMLKKQGDCIVDGTFQRKEQRDIFKEAANQLNQHLYFFFMQAEEDTIKERLKSSRKHSEADFDVYIEKKRNFDPIVEPAVELQTDKYDIDELLTFAKHQLYDKKRY